MAPHELTATGSSDFPPPEKKPGRLMADHWQIRDMADPVHPAYRYRYFPHPSVLSTHEWFHSEFSADPMF